MDIFHVLLLGGLGLTTFWNLKQRAYIEVLRTGIHEVHEIVKGMSEKTKRFEEKIKDAMGKD